MLRVLISACFAVLAETAPAEGPLRFSLEFGGMERCYFVLLPAGYSPDAVYWPLVVVHGGGGKADSNTQAKAMRRLADTEGLPALILLPELVTEDKQVSRFPALGEGAFLEAVLQHARDEFKLREKIFLSGYSMGGQFSHRFALAHPELVQACAPFAAGTWTTPDGRFLVEEYGEVKSPGAFLLDKGNAPGVPERLHDLFDARVAAVAGLPAAKGAEGVPFLVMCGTLDPRHGIAVSFFESLRDSGYTVESMWPRTPHSSNAEELRDEFAKYPQAAVSFFKRHADTSAAHAP